jgi:hypothetical protein
VPEAERRKRDSRSVMDGPSASDTGGFAVSDGRGDDIGDVDDKGRLERW